MEQGSVANLLPICTDHLNTLNKSLVLICRIREIATDVNSDILGPISDIEAQGRFNVFLNLCLLDSLVIYKSALSSVHLWEDVYTLRQGYQLIYEAIKTYSSHSKSLKILASKTSTSADILFSELTLNIKKFKKEHKYEKNIEEIRNYTICHIDKDPIRFFERISQFEEESAFIALKEFISIIVSMISLSDYIFVNYSKRIINDSSSRLSVFQEYSIEIYRLLDLLESQEISSHRF